jgi:hypothetical protein
MTAEPVTVEVEHIIRVRSADGCLQVDKDPTSGAVRITPIDDQSRMFFGKVDLILYSTDPNCRAFALAVAKAIEEMALTLPE